MTTNLIALDARRRANQILRKLPPTSAAIVAERRVALLDALSPTTDRKVQRQRRARVMQELAG